MPTERLRPRGMDGDWTKRKRFWPLRQPEPGSTPRTQPGSRHDEPSVQSQAGHCRLWLVSGFEIARDGRYDLEPESLQDLDGIIGAAVQ